jgi:hypothetical protein
MAKLGYTWYPKDWNNSESVFELTLLERGLYRELIDLAMLNDNKTIIKLSNWSRRWAVSDSDLKQLLESLRIKGVIEIDENNLFIPSCESRLNLVRGGSKGGKNKPTTKPIVKPDPKQKKRKETKVKEYRSFAHLTLSVKEFESIKEKWTKEQIDSILDSIENYALNKNYTSLNLTTRKWLKKEFPKPEDTVSTKRPEIDKLVANVALQVPKQMEELIRKGYTKEEIEKMAKS